MPELPEVETLKRELARVLIGKKIKTFQSDKFALNLESQKILSVERRAKILIFKLSKGNTLLIHLKMTGQLVYRGPSSVIGGHPEDPTKYTRAIFTFSDGSRLLFNDLRKFGWIKVVNETKLQKILSAAGVEPLGKEFSLVRFTEILGRYPKRKLKQLLLDQTLVAGLGNIYVDESCFLAGVLPTRIADSLTSVEIEKLHASIVSILKLSISKKGTSSRNYVRANGQPGGMVPHLNVYGRNKEKCKVCTAKISKIKLNGRGTHFCTHCQK